MNNKINRCSDIIVGGIIVMLLLLFVRGTVKYNWQETSTTREDIIYKGETIRIGPNTLRTVVHCQTGRTFIINDRGGTMLDLGVKNGVHYCALNMI